MASEETRPSAAEIREQLARMLAAKRFQNATNQSAFLVLVVNRALSGKKSPGHVIAKALFGGKFRKDESTDVRVTASNLRSTLTKYFELEGSDDPVRITLPKPPEDKSVRPAEGEAYTPDFSYHPFQPVAFQYRLAQALLARDLLASSKVALDQFAELLEFAPDHVGAAVGLAEAWCSSIYWYKAAGDKRLLKRISAEALKTLDRVRAKAPRHWKAHAVTGFLFTEMDRLDIARESFAEAATLSKGNVESYPPYIHFLARTGETTRALSLADHYLGSRMDDPNAYIMHADTLLWAAQYDAASRMLESALTVHGNFPLVHQRLFLMRLVQRRIDDMVAHYDQMARLIDPLSLEATIMHARRLVDSWPQDERKAFYARMKREQQREISIARAMKKLKA